MSMCAAVATAQCRPLSSLQQQQSQQRQPRPPHQQPHHAAFYRLPQWAALDALLLSMYVQVSLNLARCLPPAACAYRCWCL